MFRRAAATLQRRARLGPVHQDVPHRHRGQREKVRAVLPLGTLLPDELEIGLVHQVAGLQGPAGGHHHQLPVCDGAHLPVDAGQELIQHSAPAASTELGQGLAPCRVLVGHVVIPIERAPLGHLRSNMPSRMRVANAPTIEVDTARPPAPGRGHEEGISFLASAGCLMAAPRGAGCGLPGGSGSAPAAPANRRGRQSATAEVPASGALTFERFGGQRHEQWGSGLDAQRPRLRGATCGTLSVSSSASGAPSPTAPRHRGPTPASVAVMATSVTDSASRPRHGDRGDYDCGHLGEHHAHRNHLACEQLTVVHRHGGQRPPQCRRDVDPRAPAPSRPPARPAGSPSPTPRRPPRPPHRPSP